MIGDPHLRLDVACNDPDNGIFPHRAEMLQVATWDKEDIEFVANRRAPRFGEMIGGIRIFRRVWPILSSIEWHGNWCWNSYRLEPGVLISLLEAGKRSGLYHCDGAPSALYENWNSEERFNRDLWFANLWGRHSVGFGMSER